MFLDRLFSAAGSVVVAGEQPSADPTATAVLVAASLEPKVCGWSVLLCVCVCVRVGVALLSEPRAYFGTILFSAAAG